MNLSTVSKDRHVHNTTNYLVFMLSCIYIKLKFDMLQGWHITASVAYLSPSIKPPFQNASVTSGSTCIIWKDTHHHIIQLMNRNGLWPVQNFNPHPQKIAYGACVPRRQHLVVSSADSLIYLSFPVRKKWQKRPLLRAKYFNQYVPSVS